MGISCKSWGKMESIEKKLENASFKKSKVLKEKESKPETKEKEKAGGKKKKKQAGGTIMQKRVAVGLLVACLTQGVLGVRKCHSYSNPIKA